MIASRTFLQLLITAIIIAVVGVAPQATKNPVFEVKPASFASPAAEELPTIGSFAKFKKLMAKAIESGPRQTRGAPLMFDTFNRDLAVSAQPQRTLSANAKALSGAPNTLEAGADFSTTNVQVQGVDEADIVKTDGNYIYQITGQELVVTRALPAANMRKVATIDFTDSPGQTFDPRELYVDNHRLIVVGAAHNVGGGDNESGRHVPSVKAFVYALADGRPRLTREVEIEGDYVSSRRVGPAIYLVANKHIDAYLLERPEFKGQSKPPTFQDSRNSNGLVRPGLDEVRYFPGSTQTNYLSVAGIDLNRPDTEMQVATYLGAGEQIYASTQNLYITMTRPEKENTETSSPDTSEDSTGTDPDAPVDFGAERLIAPIVRMETAIYKFALNNGRTIYRGEGAVPGTVLNQFSMDEHEDNFRIATTSDEWAPDGQKNNIYVLSNTLDIVGRLEGLAPGERIYSARFMGPRAYLVTFKQVDPLFVIDLSDAAAPAVLGELKIPGYSDYLHPLDENHLIGFGKDAVDQGNFALFQGMKMAVFDVTDVTKPVEKWKTVIGDRGTDSPILRDHRALLVDVERRLLAFPVKVIRAQGVKSGGFNDSRYMWQGLYVYRLEDDNTLALRDTITHLPEPADPTDRHDKRRINRALYIGTTLYTISDDMIKANDLANLAEIGELLVGPAGR